MRQLTSVGKTYPYTHVQGLYGVSFGLVMFLVALSNLERPPGAAWLALAAALGVAALAGATVYYQRNFGVVSPLHSSQRRRLAGAVAGFATFVAADQLARLLLGRPPRDPVNTLVASWALGMLVYYAVSDNLRVHHIAVWGGVLVAGLLPIWGLGQNREALAFLPVGAATIAAGVIDHVVLVRRLHAGRAALALDGADGDG